jgi:hypothetical protein
VQNIEILIKDASAFIEDIQRVITEVAQVCQQRHGAAQVFPVFNVEVRTSVNAKVKGEFHLCQAEAVTGEQETFGEEGAQGAEAGIVFGRFHGRQTSLSLELLKF